MATPKIFGREPAAVAGLVEAGLTVLLAFGLLRFAGVDTAEELGLVMAVVTSGIGVYVAYVTRDTLLGYVLTAFKASVALAATYGFDLSLEQSAAVIALITAGLGFFQRTQTSPSPDPSLRVS